MENRSPERCRRAGGRARWSGELGEVSAERQIAIDRMFGEFEIPEPNRERWLLQVEELAHQMRRVVRRHRDIAPLRLGQLPVGKGALKFYDRALGVLRAGSLPDDVAVGALQVLWAIVNSFTIQEEELRADDVVDVEVLTAVRGYFESLPRDRFPNLVAVGQYFARVDLDHRFALLVELYTAGLVTAAEPRRGEGNFDRSA